jgi:O6-methylguanine-DNA--protein-cysteine methyltransferase
MDNANPLSLDELLARGGTFHGTAVRRVKLLLADGRTITADLPGVDPDEPNEPQFEPVLTDMQAAVIQVLDEAEPGERLHYELIAKKAGYSNSNWLRTFVRQCVESRNDFTKVARGIVKRVAKS